VKPTDISINDSLLGIRYNSLAIQTYEYGFKYSLNRTRILVSYVTGSHAFKSLFTMRVADQQNYVNGDVNYTFRNKIPTS